MLVRQSEPVLMGAREAGQGLHPHLPALAPFLCVILEMCVHMHACEGVGAYTHVPICACVCMSMHVHARQKP